MSARDCANPGDKCFKLTWNDPAAGEEFNAPQSFHYRQKDEMLEPNLKPVNFDYCTDSTLKPPRQATRRTSRS